MPPYELENVVGRPLLVDLGEESSLSFEHLGPAVETAWAGSDAARG